MGMKAMIFAAGMGTRLRPLTDTKPKALVEVGGKPLIDHVMDRLLHHGFDEFVVNVHHFAPMLTAYLNAKREEGLKISISDESGQLLETGGGIKHARSLFTSQEPFLIHNVDILSDVDLGALYRFHQSKGADATLLVSQRNTARYLLFDDDLRLTGWINKQTGETKSPLPSFSPQELNALAFAGIHVFSPQLFSEMDGWNDRFSIMDFYLSLSNRKQIIGLDATGMDWIDVGKLSVLQDADAWCQRHEPARK